MGLEAAIRAGKKIPLASARGKIKRGHPEEMTRTEREALERFNQRQEMERLWRIENPGIPHNPEIKERLQTAARVYVGERLESYKELAEIIGVDDSHLGRDIKRYCRFWVMCLLEEQKRCFSQLQEELQVRKVESLARNMNLAEKADKALEEVLAAPTSDRNAMSKVQAHDRVKMNLGMVTSRGQKTAETGPALRAEAVNVIKDLIGITRDLVGKPALPAITVEAEVEK